MAISRRKRKYLLLLLGGLVLSCLFLVLWAFVIEPNRLVVNEVTMTLPGWPPSIDPLRVALISDLHAGSHFIDEAKLRLVVEKTNGARPDLILLAGDFMVTSRYGRAIEPEVIAGELKNLSAPLGVFAVLGNHDWWYDGERVRRALNSVGIRVLENEVVQLGRPGESFWLGGIADAWTRRPDIASVLRNVSDDGPVILITHNPDIFPDVPQRVALTLAGHTHGGQVSIPFIGRPQVPSRYGERYAIGHIIEDGRHLFVTPGVGTSILPVRFRVPPEISLLTLTARATP